MSYIYKRGVSYENGQSINIRFINDLCKRYPNEPLLVEIPNTKAITSSIIRQLPSNVMIRIAGGYDKERIERYKKLEKKKNSNYFGNESVDEYYYNSVIYSRNETIKILEAIEKIESGINPNWSEIQKVIYVYEKLKRGVMYDPKYEHKTSRDVRSLRGLISRETVCAGYAVIFKEFMDRLGIACEFARGGRKKGQTGGHAWNIITIKGKKYPIDLTWDNTKFRSGNFKTLDWLGCDTVTFSECHYPAPGETTQEYKNTLSQIDPKEIKNIYLRLGLSRARDYSSTTYTLHRADGTKCIIAQVGNNIINGTNYYRYYYVDVSKDVKMQKPLILYSQSNITSFIDRRNFKLSIPPGYESSAVNVLFSRENIADSLARGTCFIGNVKKDNPGNKYETVKSYREISKLEDKRNLFKYETKIYTRSDGSVFTAQLMSNKPINVNGTELYHFDIFEMVKENGKNVIKGNSVYTERNFFLDKRPGIADDFLSRARLDRKFAETGGYIGFYDANGIRTYNPNLVTYFETSQRIDFTKSKTNNPSQSTPKQYPQRTQPTVPNIQIPTFTELKALAQKYELFADAKATGNSKVQIRDIKTKQIVTDQSLIEKATFANIWLTSAGIKWYYDEPRAGMVYAFNDGAERLYNQICIEMQNSCRRKGVVDSIELFRNHINDNSYKYNQDIITNLFRSPYQAEAINNLFMHSVGKKPVLSTEPLYNMEYVHSIVNTSGSTYGRR